MTSPENLHTKNAINELSFPLVTHMALSTEWFGSYGLSRRLMVLNGFGTDWTLERNPSFRAQYV
jgi:hypothetical protein